MLHEGRNVLGAGGTVLSEKVIICLISFSKCSLEAILLSLDASEIVSTLHPLPSQFMVSLELSSSTVLLMSLVWIKASRFLKGVKS